MDQQRFIAVLSEVAAAGQGGLQIHEPGTARTLKNLPGSWSDLALACLIHVGARPVQNTDFQLIEQQINRGIPPAATFRGFAPTSATAGWWRRSVLVPSARLRGGAGRCVQRSGRGRRLSAPPRAAAHVGSAAAVRPSGP
jgi:hypothetical protein